MTPKPSKWVGALSGGLLLSRGVSGFYLTLSNFQPVSTLSLPLKCIFAYNTPLQGCVLEDFGHGAFCSSSCQHRVVRIQTSIQKSCAMVSTGTRSLLGEAQNGRLVAAICRSAPSPSPSSPPESTSIESRAPSPTSTQTTPDSTSGDGLSATASTPTSASASESIATSTSRSAAGEDDDGVQATSITATGPRSTPFTPGQSPSATTATTQEAHSSISSPSTSTSSTTTSSAAAQTRPKGGGGSPFDPVPDSGAHRSGSRTARLFAVVGSCIVGMCLLLY
ncbi:hypothetical protein E4U43_005630 [Claviceps pusilla]|uniref:Uncharacterized protein n=1 Tax=Claviceps pusilla TaxID=123648 RepID=A0A9P7SW18_9HYPO|nr:hypothetical protein E4U43_005630 [Claviceps pusilla]